ncbi:MAG: sigma factor-like helix-turn-helix DNA-binding protein [Patescibacteria group bacterium]
MSSILDRVLISKEETERRQFDPVDVVNTLLRQLSSKEADVLRRRFGLTEQGEETLEHIGNVYQVTRERIRQIEGTSIKKIKQSSIFSDTIRPVEHVVMNVLHQYGGALTDDMLMSRLLQANKDNLMGRKALRFILERLLDEKIDWLAETKKQRATWSVKNPPLEFFHKMAEHLAQLITTKAVPQTFDQLYELFKTQPFFSEHADRTSADVVLSVLHVSQLFDQNPFDEYGLASWGQIVPKRMNDRIYLVLKKHGKPMHFVEIADTITKIFKKKAYPPTVHNELILNEQYVLVGRGMYALKEWGFKAGVVADIVADVVKRAGKPLTREEVVAEVLKQRLVKRNTVHLALTDKQRFSRTSDGKYQLVPTAT